MRHAAFAEELSRDTLIDWYRRTRDRSRELFGLFVDAVYYDRPIPLRNPLVFYEGHLPAFAVNTLVKLAQRGRGIDERLEVLFARGIDPEDEASVPQPSDLWPSRAEVRAYAAAADELVVRAIADGPLVDPDVPALRGGEAVFTIIEHELMHQETLLYLLHALPEERKVRPDSETRAALPPRSGRAGMVRVPAGMATLGAAPGDHFGWDNEFTLHRVHVAAFDVDVHDVTNGQYLAFVEETGASPSHFWIRTEDGWKTRAFFGPDTFAADAPVYVTHEQAAAYARWRGMRLPTEAEFHRAAFGSPEGVERVQPWGDEAPDATRGVFDFASWDPLPVGSRPAGASAWGVHDLVGNGWEWTSTVFAPFAGFEAMPSYPQYSADFFDGAHYVMKGASPVTPRELVRRSFRNWFRPNYPYVYATFRCARSA